MSACLAECHVTEMDVQVLANRALMKGGSTRRMKMNVCTGVKNEQYSLTQLLDVLVRTRQSFVF